MCGIVGYVGNRPVVDILIRGLKRLEYRGYDSAGIAFFHKGKIEIKKSEGRLENVEKLVNGSAKLFQDAKCGIGHTRWATHGKPTTQNAHPHRAGHVVLVHNGIIENYQQIKREVVERGFRPESETDSELYAFLVLEEMNKSLPLAEAVRRSFLRLEGSCSVVVISEQEPGVVVGVRNGSPLVAATDPKGGAILASDAQPILEFTQNVTFLQHGDMAIGGAQGLRFVDLATGNEVKRETTRLDWSLENLDKQGFPHYMLKEIHEQPAAVIDTLNVLLDRAKSQPFALIEQPAVKLTEEAEELTVVGCGTSWHSALLGKYWIERWAGIPVNVELASEFRYRKPVLRKNSVVIAISQSGETADTLGVIREVKKNGIPTIGLTNVRGSTISREADALFYTSAGPEIGVAATKTFMTQILVFLLLAGHLGIRRRDPKGIEALEKVYSDLLKLPHLLSDYLDPKSERVSKISEVAEAFSKVDGFFFMGRGYSFPIALESALKLKEIAYVHAEGYAAGELKHGPIAMIDKNIAVVVLAPRDRWREKTVSNLEEVKARGARILGIGESDDKEFSSLCDYFIPCTDPSQGLDECLVPFFLTLIVQLLSYHTGVLHGCDVDKPRNLAKSVTVE